MKVLHITNWFPTSAHPKDAPWIKSNIMSLPSSAESDIVHFQIKSDRTMGRRVYRDGNVKQILVTGPWRYWFLLEALYFVWLCFEFGIKKVHRRYDIINFHIAYPMLTYWHIIKRYVKKPVVISEHWSAYHFNFGISKPLRRIQRIFAQNIPVITVSQALANDIRNFAGVEFPTFIVPNAVDTETFYPDPGTPRENCFFMVSNWKSPRDPFPVMQAFLEFDQHGEFTLAIGGYGPLWDDMRKWVERHNASERILLLGLLSSHEVAARMQKCRAFLHPSGYETFSVVCAEAVSCGAVVIAPGVGGIPEVVGEHGILIGSSTKVEWFGALQRLSSRDTIKTPSAPDRYSADRVGKIYYAALKNIVNHTGLSSEIPAIPKKA